MLYGANLLHSGWSCESRRRMESLVAAHIPPRISTLLPTMSANPARLAYRSGRESTR